MYKEIKKLLWAKIDSEIFSEFSFSPHKKSANWRIYSNRKLAGGAFLTVRFFDVAGGSFVFCGGVSLGGWPEESDDVSSVFSYPAAGGFSLVGPEAFYLPAAVLSVDLEWQTPSAGLIEEAFSVPQASALFNQLGVTLRDRHHLLSYGILDALGVNIPESEFNNLSEKFQKDMGAMMEKSIRRMLARL